MGKSKSKKMRDKLAKEKGFDVHATKRGGDGIDISLLTRTTKTKKEKLSRSFRKDKQNRYQDSAGGSFFVPRTPFHCHQTPNYL